MISRRTDRKLVQFLKERGLYQSYRTYQKAKNIKREKIEYEGVSLNITSYRRNGKTYFANTYDLKTVATSKRYKPGQAGEAFKKNRTRNIKTLFHKDGTEYHIVEKKSDLRFKGAILSQDWENVRVQQRSSPLRQRKGQLWMSARFSKGNKHRTVEGGSNTKKRLDNKTMYNQAWNEAFKGCLSQIDFSYDDCEILWVRCIYYEPKI